MGARKPAKILPKRREREGAFRLLQVGGRHSRTPIIARNITGGLDENTSESTCNRSAGGRRHDRKCPTVRKPHSPVRTEGRRSQCAHYHSAGRGRKAWNYRTGQGRWREPHSGIRKPHRTVRTEGRRSQSAALTSENWRVTNEGAEAPSAASASCPATRPVAVTPRAGTCHQHHRERRVPMTAFQIARICAASRPGAIAEPRRLARPFTDLTARHHAAVPRLFQPRERKSQ